MAEIARDPMYIGTVTGQCSTLFQGIFYSDGTLSLSREGVDSKIIMVHNCRVHLPSSSETSSSNLHILVLQEGKSVLQIGFTSLEQATTWYTLFARCLTIVPKAPTHVIIRKVWLIRHGHYLNAASTLHDNEQILSEMGKQQAERVGRYYLPHLLSIEKSVTIVHSSLTRAVQTANIMMSISPSEVSCYSDDLLQEGWPGQPYANGGCHEKSGDEESVRLEKAFHKWIVGNEDEEKNRIIVCHANIIRYFLCKSIGVDAAGHWGHLEVYHTGVSRVEVYSSGMTRVISMNETGHLPENLQTSTEDHLV